MNRIESKDIPRNNILVIIALAVTPSAFRLVEAGQVIELKKKICTTAVPKLFKRSI